MTLAGLMFWRGAAFKVASGETIAPLDPTYALIGGGPYGSIGSTWSWAVGLVACAGIVWDCIAVGSSESASIFRFGRCGRS